MVSGLTIAKRVCAPVVCLICAGTFALGAWLPGGASAQSANTSRPVDIAQAESASRADIMQVQSTLNALGYDAGTADGLMGPRTHAALVQFQGDYGVAVSGMLDAATRAALLRATDGAMERATPLNEATASRSDLATHHDLSADGIMDIQRRLNGAGYDAGAPDGVMDDDVQSAVAAFQKDLGLPDNGIVGMETLEALNTLSLSERTPAQDFTSSPDSAAPTGSEGTWTPPSPAMRATPPASLVAGPEADPLLKSRLLLEAGYRDHAIAAALKAFPADMGPEALPPLEDAYLSLYRAVRAPVARFPVVNDEVVVSAMSIDLKRATLRFGNEAGARVLALANLETGATAPILTDAMPQSIYTRYDPQVFNPQGDSLVAGAEGARVLVLNADSGRIEMTLPALSGGPGSNALIYGTPDPLFIDFAFNPNGERLAVLQQNPLGLTIWDLAAEEKVLEWSVDRLAAVADFASGDPFFLAGSFASDSTFCLGIAALDLLDPVPAPLALLTLDLPSGAFHKVTTAEGHTGSPDTSVVCSRDGQYVAASYLGQTREGIAVHDLHLWRRADGEELHIAPNVAAIGFDPQSRYLAMVSQAQTMFLDLTTMALVPYPYGPDGFEPTNPMVVGADGTQFYVAPSTPIWHHQVDRIWQPVPEGAGLLAFAQEMIGPTLAQEVALARQAGSEPPTPDPIAGRAADSQGWARLSAELLDQGRRDEAIAAALKGIPEGASDLSLYASAHDALYAAMASMAVRLPVEDNSAFAIAHAVSSDLTRVVLARNLRDTENQLELWDAEAGERITVLADDVILGPYYYGDGLAISPDSTRIALVTPDGLTRIFDAEDGALEHTLNLFPDGEMASDHALPWTVAFSPDSARLLVASGSASGHANAVVAWDMADASIAYEARGQTLHMLSDMGGARLRADAVWADSEHLCLVMSEMVPQSTSEFAGMALGLVDLATDGLTPFASVRGHGQSIGWPLGCSSDASMIAVAYGPSGTEKTRVGFWHQGRNEPVLSYDGMPSGIVFSPDGRTVALMPGGAGANLNWVFLDLESGEAIGYPGSPSGYHPRSEILHAGSGAPILGALVVVDKQRWVWPKLEKGAGLIAQGLAELGPDARAAMISERIAQP